MMNEIWLSQTYREGQENASRKAGQQLVSFYNERTPEIRGSYDFPVMDIVQ